MVVEFSKCRKFYDNRKRDPVYMLRKLPSNGIPHYRPERYPKQKQTAHPGTAAGVPWLTSSRTSIVILEGYPKCRINRDNAVTSSLPREPNSHLRFVTFVCLRVPVRTAATRHRERTKIIRRNAPPLDHQDEDKTVLQSNKHTLPHSYQVIRHGKTYLDGDTYLGITHPSHPPTYELTTEKYKPSTL